MPDHDLLDLPSERTWRIGLDDSRLLTVAAYAFPSILGGVVFLGVALVGWLALEAILAGDIAQALGIVALAMLAVLIRPYVLLLFTTTAGDALRERYSARGLVVGSALGALFLVGSSRLHPIGPISVFVGSWVPHVIAAAFPTEGSAAVDPPMLVVDGTDVPLDAIRGYRSIERGGIVISWLSYSSGVPAARRLLIIPVEDFTVVRELLETAAAADGDRSPIAWQVRGVAALFGLGMMAVGPTLWVLLPTGDGRLVGILAGAMFGVFGGLLLWYAYVG